MKKNIATTAALLVCRLALAQSAPPLVNYQGKLTTQTGGPLPAGLYQLQFRLWDSPTVSGINDLVWGQQLTNVAVQSNGVFGVILGTSTGASPIPGTTQQVNNLSYAFANPAVFLGVTVSGINNVANPSATEILPRQQLLSVPFAFNALNASNAAIASVASSVVNGSIGLTNLASRAVVTNSTVQNPAPIGSIAFSSDSGTFSTTTPTNVPALSVTIITSGRPVYVGLISTSGSQDSELGIRTQSIGTSPATDIVIQRNNSSIARYNLQVATGDGSVWVPPSSVNYIDPLLPASTYTYSIYLYPGEDGDEVFLEYTRLVVYEF